MINTLVITLYKSKNKKVELVHFFHQDDEKIKDAGYNIYNYHTKEYEFEYNLDLKKTGKYGGELMGEK